MMEMGQRLAKGQSTQKFAHARASLSAWRVTKNAESAFF